MDPRIILIADDEPSDREAVKRALKHANIMNEVRCVHDGAQTIAYLEGQGFYADRLAHPYPGLLLLDLRMPKISGLDVLEWIRSHPQHCGLGIVVLTGTENVRDLNRAYELGAHSFLTKPPLIEELLNLVTGLKGIYLETSADGRQLCFDTGVVPHPRADGHRQTSDSP